MLNSQGVNNISSRRLFKDTKNPKEVIYFGIGVFSKYITKNKPNLEIADPI